MSLRILGMLVGVGLAAGMAGCGSDAGQADGAQGASPSPTSGAPGSSPVGPSATPSGTDPDGLSNLTPPIRPRPSGPPREPTDGYQPYWLTGELVPGESACLGLVLDDGRRYALYNPDKVALPAGERVSVKVVGGAMPRIACGPGIMVRVLERKTAR